MALARAVAPLGHAKPRISPPVPVKSDVAGFRDTAAAMGIMLMPWQEFAARFLTATNADDRLLYREICIVVARQQGKTTLMKPHIVRALRAGKRVMMIAQNRELPRHMFGIVADAIAAADESLLPRRRGKITWPRYGSGQEEILLTNGGSLRIAAAGRGGARGFSNDIVIIDELREMESFDVIGAVEPTLTMSPDAQLIYLSNAGHDNSVVLNAVRARAGKDESLAYLEWSAAPERAPDDPEGWAEADPALGHFPSVLESLEHSYRAHNLAGTMALFETENLCRWVTTMSPRLINDALWQGSKTKTPLERPRLPVMAVSMHPDGTRASAVAGWQQSDGTIALRLVADVTGSPIDTDAFTNDLVALAQRRGIRMTGFDAKTDAEMARYFPKDHTKSVIGTEYVNASAAFVRFVEGGRLRWDGDDVIGADLAFIARKDVDTGWQAVPAKDDRPVTAGLAAIRAAWLVSVRRPTKPRIF